ncbi:MarR family winged helix-turn-helix transcriptional regulator [Rhodopila sp.]|uniref:MarR family winged helix-turn-helix transcriptional regulator n=1 Tax=Rhodopila sp. TaxID=2480087 RepID=UPI003D115D49
MKDPVQGAGADPAEAFRLEDFLPYRLSVASDNVSRLITRQHFGRSGLAMPEWRLLATVGRYGVLSPTTAGEHTSMDKVKVSRAAANLVGRGLLRQTQDPNDGRGRLLRLTRRGITAYAGIAPTARQIEQSISVGLTRSEWTVLHRALGKLIDHTRLLLNDTSADHSEGVRGD